MKKQFISAQDHFEDSFRLALKIYESGYRPDYIIGIWRGGASVGIIIHEFLAYVGVKADHIPIRTSYRRTSYKRLDDKGQGKLAKTILVDNTRFLVDRVNREDNLLIVDDVYSSGRNVKAVIDHLSQKLERNMPSNIRVAVPYYKPTLNRTGRVPDYYVHESQDELVMPHELNRLNAREIKQHRQCVEQLAPNI